MGFTPVETILQTLKLLLPALIPSWRFFDTIAPSPRIEFTLLETAQETPVSWQEFRPLPSQLPVSSMLKRMFWNPRWNESLFLVSCAERLMANPTEHSSQEILNRIAIELKQGSRNAMATPYLQFRLVFLSREGTEIHQDITFISPVHRYIETANP
ncbi:MAG: hypothetical protein JKX94_06325 [Sneathiella sp.]|nr:hypothetical protein [Sneathiella sp.]